jgi:hypothetical protein
MSKRNPPPSAADPVFAAIRQQRLAWKAVRAAMDQCFDEPTEPNKIAEESAAQEERRIRAQLERMSPSTRAGVRAILRWAIEWYQHRDDAEGALIRRIARSPLLADSETEGRTA